MFQFQMVRFKGQFTTHFDVVKNSFNSKWCDLKGLRRLSRQIFKRVSIPNGAI